MKPIRFRQRVVGGAAAAILIVVLAFLFRTPLMRTFSFFQRPFARAGTWLTDQAAHACGGMLAIDEHNVDDLIAQRNALAVDDAELQELRTENEQLRAQLGFVERRQFTGVTASIVSRSASLRSYTFLIDRGSADGIVVGAPVVVGDGLLVGKVTAVQPTTATVTATTDPQMATAATLLNQTRTLGLAQGMASNLIGLHYIPNDEVVRVNDLVVTSGLEEHMPSGLIIGIVNDVQGEPTDPFQEAVVQSLVDIRRYSIVTVLNDAEAL